MIPDKEIEKLYKVISDFNDFEEYIKKRIFIRLSDCIKVDFINADFVQIEIENKKYTLINQSFYSILSDLKTQRESDILQSIRNVENEKVEKRRGELTKIDEVTYKAEPEFIDCMTWARDTATGNPLYKRMLAKIISVFRNGGQLVFENKKYKNEKEFINGYICKLCGFVSLDTELK